MQAALDASWPDAKFVVRGRAKSKETLAEKLNRMGPHTLPIIRDLAGIRVVGKMSRRQQDQVMSDACRALGYEKPKLIDRRQSPSFGYRALHAELVYQGCKIEVQVRTELQHLWADAYERFADTLGREIRYSSELRHLTSDERALVGFMQELSTYIDEVERQLVELEEAEAEAEAARARLRVLVDRIKAAKEETADIEGMIRIRIIDTLKGWQRTPGAGGPTG